MITINEIMELMEAYCKVVIDGLQERWEKLPIELYESETYETIGGLMARQATLSTELAMSPSIWNVNIAPLVLRCMTDAHITLAWILKDPSERAKQYIMYGLGQEKLLLEHYKNDADPEDVQIKKLIKMKEHWINSQRRDFSIEVNVGNWAGTNTRQMAIESDCEGLYKFAYQPFSGAAHNMWHHISIYNLKPCVNPLHKNHRVPYIFEMHPEPDFVYRSAKYVDRSFEAVDATYNLDIVTKMPVEQFVDSFDRLYQKDKEKESTQPDNQADEK